MNILDTIKTYYKFASKIKLTIEMSGGIKGKPRVMTLNEALDDIKGYEMKQVVNVMFQTHFIFKNEITAPMAYPNLYIMYM